MLVIIIYYAHHVSITTIKFANAYVRSIDFLDLIKSPIL